MIIPCESFTKIRSEAMQPVVAAGFPPSPSKKTFRRGFNAIPKFSRTISDPRA
jgi:hypothetical protein